MRRVAGLQAVEHESLGGIERWLLNKGCMLSHRVLFQEEPLPEVESVDFLIMTPISS